MLQRRQQETRIWILKTTILHTPRVTDTADFHLTHLGPWTGNREETAAFGVSHWVKDRRKDSSGCFSDALCTAEGLTSALTLSVG